MARCAGRSAAPPQSLDAWLADKVSSVVSRFCDCEPAAASARSTPKRARSSIDGEQIRTFLERTRLRSCRDRHPFGKRPLRRARGYTVQQTLSGKISVCEAVRWNRILRSRTGTSRYSILCWRSDRPLRDAIGQLRIQGAILLSHSVLREIFLDIVPNNRR